MLLSQSHMVRSPDCWMGYVFAPVSSLNDAWGRQCMSADVLHEMVRQMERKQGRLHANFRKVYHTLTSGTVSKNPKTRFVDRLEPPPPQTPQPGPVLGLVERSPVGIHYD